MIFILQVALNMGVFIHWTHSIQSLYAPYLINLLFWKVKTLIIMGKSMYGRSYYSHSFT